MSCLYKAWSWHMNHSLLSTQWFHFIAFVIPRKLLSSTSSASHFCWKFYLRHSYRSIPDTEFFSSPKAHLESCVLFCIFISWIFCFDYSVKIHNTCVQLKDQVVGLLWWSFGLTGKVISVTADVVMLFLYLFLAVTKQNQCKSDLPKKRSVPNTGHRPKW